MCKASVKLKIIGPFLCLGKDRGVELGVFIVDPTTRKSLGYTYIPRIDFRISFPTVQVLMGRFQRHPPRPVCTQAQLR